MRFLARFVPQERGSQTSFLRVARSLAENLGVSARNPKWTSYGALEIDVFAKNKADFETLVATIEPLARVEFTRNLEEAPRHLEKREGIELARSYFNQERFWESHEILEALWRVASGTEKTLLQGLILLDAAFVHVQKSESDVAMGVFRRALPQLNWADTFYEGIDIGKARKMVRRVIDECRFEVFRI